MKIKITPDVLAVLDASEVRNSVLLLPGAQLERSLYLAVNKVTEALGGKWSRKDKGHVFSKNPRELLEAALLTGEVTDLTKLYQFFETPAAIAKRMVELAALKPGVSVLEPSAGHGAIASQILSSGVPVDLTLVESDPGKIELLHRNFGDVVYQDFLTFNGSFDRIIMNPPFAKGQDMQHVQHAYSLLEPSGILVSVVSESPFFRETTQARQFRAFLDESDAEIVDLPSGAFRSSGTEVKSRIIRITKNVAAVEQAA